MARQPAWRRRPGLLRRGNRFLFRLVELHDADVIVPGTAQHLQLVGGGVLKRHSTAAVEGGLLCHDVRVGCIPDGVLRPGHALEKHRLGHGRLLRAGHGAIVVRSELERLSQGKRDPDGALGARVPFDRGDGVRRDGDHVLSAVCPRPCGRVPRRAIAGVALHLDHVPYGRKARVHGRDAEHQVAGHSVGVHVAMDRQSRELAHGAGLEGQPGGEVLPGEVRRLLLSLLLPRLRARRRGGMQGRRVHARVDGELGRVRRDAHRDGDREHRRAVGDDLVFGEGVRAQAQGGKGRRGRRCVHLLHPGAGGAASICRGHRRLHGGRHHPRLHQYVLCGLPLPRLPGARLEHAGDAHLGLPDVPRRPKTSAEGPGGHRRLDHGDEVHHLSLVRDLRGPLHFRAAPVEAVRHAIKIGGLHRGGARYARTDVPGGQGDPAEERQRRVDNREERRGHGAHARWGYAGGAGGHRRLVLLTEGRRGPRARQGVVAIRGVSARARRMPGGLERAVYSHPRRLGDSDPRAAREGAAGRRCHS
mmetsp:Transcript_28350/g.81477  ORF Transcript_28350/g.81477 Transcript_28350/m.81477 type:complete len:531 (+) Transcript_28350:1183-2775(+)